MAENAVTCPSCGGEEVFCTDGTRSPPLHEVGEFTCNICKTRVVYGNVMPRIVVEPFIDQRKFRWTRIRIQDPATKEDLLVRDLDPKLVLRLANNLLSMVTP